MVKESAIKPPRELTITHKEFLGVLRRWDEYIYAELSEMPRGFSVITDAESLNMGGRVPLHTELTRRVILSELSKLLWESLHKGASEVDRIHDEAFAQEQANFFKLCFGNAEAVQREIRRSHFGFVYYEEDGMTPTDMFRSLSKEAQMIIVRDGHLDDALRVWDEVKALIRAEKQAEVGCHGVHRPSG